MQSTGKLRRGKSAKPKKPRKDFPLFPHATRRWAKKINGKLHYFGPWEDAQGALSKYLDQRDALLAGRKPRVERTGVSLRHLANHFLTFKAQRRDAGEIALRTFDEYYAICEVILEAFGKDRLVDDLDVDDFAALRNRMAKRFGPVTLGNQIQRVRSVFKYGYDAGLIPVPVRFGPAFARPAKKVLRKARAAKGPRMFEAADLRKLIKAASAPLNAMILLGINCGFGNADCGTLPLPLVKPGSGWLEYPRPKTGISRRCPLWPVTVKALRDVLKVRPTPKDTAAVDRFFVTKYGGPWTKQTMDNPIAKEFRKLLDDLGLHRSGLGFYTLRHVFETIGGESKDQAAVDHIMGHARDDMASVYREKISDERLRAVTDHVHGWLFPTAKKGKLRRPK